MNPNEWRALLADLVDYVLPPVDGFGGVAAGVPEYIEHMLENRHGSDYQVLISRGLQTIQQHCQEHFATGFSNCNAQQCIQLLTDLETNASRHYQVFWQQFIRLCLEGFISPPRHGGNRDSGAWRLMGYPGNSSTRLSLTSLAN